MNKTGYFLLVSLASTSVLSCKSIFRHSLKAKCTIKTTHAEQLHNNLQTVIPQTGDRILQKVSRSSQLPENIIHSRNTAHSKWIQVSPDILLGSRFTNVFLSLHKATSRVSPTRKMTCSLSNRAMP